jgi:urease accessory protein
VTVESKLVFRDAILLDQELESLADACCMGRYDCLGLILMLGPDVAVEAGAIVAWAAAEPIHDREDLIFSVSPVAGGAVIRVAGMQTETVARWIRQRLGFLTTLLGADPWSRKW